jgi:acyl carrier protein
MTDDEILARLTPVFQDVFDDDDIVPHPEMVAGDVSEWDSLSHIRLIISIEKAFQVKFTAAEVGALSKVGDVVTLISKKLA